ncbi:nucleotide pyrophosphohydrolase [Clostridium butyricum]|nr:nucleotide pyrophosphohydrolase [Clostridium butyricum]ALP91039.1 nucleotide pyrophosphohydrolase [Clostridium butyricum]ANF14662.1 nucleotide pyrophosphohydrolase [Clostridium butyricum]AOR94729.1 nucleotide pyrophosphohydrolase [Clostridium butyricum]MCI3008888.1 nucleotide pyrophosphohydrolase [Clostridium butyricum]MDP0840946.1 nucleotide pyrophosphohydrolase [Clostridium butyricum]
MDNKANIQELKDIIKQFCDDRDWEQFHNPKDLAIGLSTEANELLSLFRFKNEDEMKEIFANPKKREDIEDETADVFFFLLRFAQMYGIDLEDALKRKIEKNNKKYSVEKFKGSNKKYSEE